MKTSVLSIIVTLVVCALGIPQTKFVTPPENLYLDGVPQVPVSLTEDVNKYTEFRAATFINWHPVKREMIISTRFGDVAQIHSVKFPGGDRKQLTFFKEPVHGGVFEPNKGSYLIFEKDLGGNENYQLFRFDLPEGALTMLTDGKSRNGGPGFSNKGDRIVYNSTRRNGNDVDFYIMDPMKPETDKILLENQGGGWSALDWSPDDTKLLIHEYVSINESYLYIYDIASGTKTLLTPKSDKEKIAYDLAKFDASGKGIYFTTDKESEFFRFAHMDIATKKIEYLTSDIPWDIQNVSINKDRTLAAFESNEEGVSVLRVLNLKTMKRILLPKLPTAVYAGFAWHNNNEDLGITLNSAKGQNDVYSINIKKKTFERWTESESGGLNTQNFQEAKLIRWKGFDGLPISGFLYAPPAKYTGKRPVIIDVHGGPEGQANPDFLGRYNYYLNELGVAVILPNVRGSSGFGKTFLKLDDGFLRENSYKDISTLIDWIKEQPGLDADRIMVTGGSYGGNVTLAMSAFYSDKIRCAVSVVGASNLVTFLENTSGYRRDLRRVEYGDEREPKMREYLEKIAPMNHAEDIKKPLFIIQGANDPRVPASEGDQMVKKLKSINTPVWYMLGKDEGHGFQKKVNRDYQFYSTVMFIKEFLLK